MASIFTKKEIAEEHKAAVWLNNFYKNYRNQLDEKKLASYSMMEPLKLTYKPLLDASDILAKKLDDNNQLLKRVVPTIKGSQQQLAIDGVE